jgi:hypothetical protein
MSKKCKLEFPDFYGFLSNFAFVTQFLIFVLRSPINVSTVRALSTMRIYYIQCNYNNYNNINKYTIIVRTAITDA